MALKREMLNTFKMNMTNTRNLTAVERVVALQYEQCLSESSAKFAPIKIALGRGFNLNLRQGHEHVT